MVFSSFSFLFIFLPLFLLLYFFSPPKFKNFVLFSASILFYYIGAGEAVAILFANILLNYFAGLLIARASTKSVSKIILVLGIIFNLEIIFYFKYATFVAENINGLFSCFNINAGVPVIEVLLPIGISFYVFQGISYIIDVYRKEIAPTRNILNFATYISMFPQLVAGPIVRYECVGKDLSEKRRFSLDDTAEGVKSFCSGLIKKVLVADTLGFVVDQIYALPNEQLSFIACWTAAFAYMLQIFFYFSGYSDMAIGIGKMLGFKFPQNFNYPYISKSVREFWQRWHMTLLTGSGCTFTSLWGKQGFFRKDLF